VVIKARGVEGQAGRCRQGSVAAGRQRAGGREGVRCACACGRYAVTGWVVQGGSAGVTGDKREVVGAAGVCVQCVPTQNIVPME